MPTYTHVLRLKLMLRLMQRLMPRLMTRLLEQKLAVWRLTEANWKSSSL